MAAPYGNKICANLKTVTTSKALTWLILWNLELKCLLFQFRVENCEDFVLVWVDVELVRLLHVAGGVRSLL